MDQLNTVIRLRLVDKWPPNQRYENPFAFDDMMKKVCHSVVSQLGDALSIKTMDRYEGVIASFDESRQLRHTCGHVIPYGYVVFNQYQGIQGFPLDDLKVIATALQKESERELGYAIDDAEIVIRCS